MADSETTHSNLAADAVQDETSSLIESDAGGPYVVKATGRLWQITSEILRQLLATGSWVQASTSQTDPPFHLLLGDRGRVQFAHLVGRQAPPTRFSDVAGPAAARVMVNSYRGCNALTNKSALARTMRHFAREHGLTMPQLEYLPSTFILRPGEPNDERDEFLAEFQRIQQEIESTVAASSCGAPAKNAWIAKANRGAKGDSIFVSDDASQLIAYIDARATDDSLAAASAAVAPSSVAAVSAVSPDGSSSPSDPSSEPPRPAPLAARAPPLRSRLALHSRTGSLAAAASNSWVLQRYIDRPFLIQRRKFDIRCWILVDAEYRVFLYRNGVCRTSSTEFNMENLGDTFVHLTNHCIQEAHPDFNKQEQGNELFFPELQTYLDSLPDSPLHPRLCVICHLLPQIRRVVSDTLRAVRGSMSTTGEYHSFQLFGYDFMLDERFHLRMLEINATPASAEKLLQAIVRHMMERTVGDVYNTKTNTEESQSPSQSHSLPSSPHADSATILSQPCHCSSLLRGATKQHYLAPADESINLFDLVDDRE